MECEINEWTNEHVALHIKYQEKIELWWTDLSINLIYVSQLNVQAKLILRLFMFFFSPTETTFRKYRKMFHDHFL